MFSPALVVERSAFHLVLITGSTWCQPCCVEQQDEQYPVGILSFTAIASFRRASPLLNRDGDVDSHSGRYSLGCTVPAESRPIFNTSRQSQSLGQSIFMGQ